jgi:hypothetical protein
MSSVKKHSPFAPLPWLGRIIATAILAGCGWSAVARAQAVDPAAPASGTRWAQLVGVDQYEGIGRLKYCSRDVRGLKARLLAAGFPESHIFLLDDKPDGGRQPPTKANIENDLDAMLRQTRPGDVVIVSFSGHGVCIGGKSYLCPREANLNRLDTLIPLDTFYSRLAASAAGVRMMVVDACRNDPSLGRGVAEPKRFEQFVRTQEHPPQGVIVLTSCAPGQQSLEVPEFKNGAFMHFVIEGMGGAVDMDGGNRDGLVSLLELYRYASLKTRRYAAETFEEMQTPALWGELIGDCDLCTVPAAYQPATPAPTVQRPRVSTPGRSAESVARLRSALLVLEAAVTWDAVEDDWRNLRDDWIASVKNAANSGAVAQLLWKFEQNIRWLAVSTEWTELRPDWVQRCRAATSPNEVASLMIELELNILWRAVSPQWKEYRASWLDFVHSAGK